MHYRKIQQSDNFKVAQMIRAVFDEYEAKTEGTVYTDPTTDRLFELFEENNAVLFIAEDAGEIKGCCGIFPTPGLPKDCAELVKYYVAGDARGTGIGRKLYEKSETFAITSGYKNLYIESTPDFIQAVGFMKKSDSKYAQNRSVNPVILDVIFGC